MLDTRCCPCSFENLSVNISKQWGEHLKPTGFLEMPVNIWFLLSGEEKPSSVSSYSCLGHCFISLDIASLFFLSVWSWKVLEKVLCTSCTLNLIWSRTIKLLKDMLILLNSLKNYKENCNFRMMINETEFLLVTELWNTLSMENVGVIVYIENNHKSFEIFTICILQP